MKKSLVIFTFIAFSIFGIGFFTHTNADTSCVQDGTTSEYYECLYNESKAAYDEAQSRADSAAKSAQDLANQTKAVEEEIVYLNEQIPQIEADMAETEAEIELILQSMQIANNSNVWVAFMMNATGPQDMMDRVLLTTNIQQSQEEKVKELAAQQKLLEQQKITLEAKESELEQLHSEAVAMQNSTAYEAEEAAAQAAIAEEQYQWCIDNIAICDAQNTAVGAFELPFSNGQVNYTYGVPSPDYGGNHYGMDFATSSGSVSGVPMYAAGPGTVIDVNTGCGSGYIGSQCGGGWGNYVYVVYNYQGQDVGVLYAHLSSVSVSRGDSVNSSTQIGNAGSSGSSSGAHMHVEVHTCASAGYSTCPKSGRSNPATYFGIENYQGYTWTGR